MELVNNVNLISKLLQMQDLRKVIQVGLKKVTGQDSEKEIVLAKD